MEKYMRMALELAGKADPFPNPAVGALLVKDGKVIGKGYHKKAGLPHAEIEAIQDAERRTGNDAARSATLYVTLEPCSHKNKRTKPCTDAIKAAGIAKVVFAMKDPNPLVSGAAVLRKVGISVVGPVAEKQARMINRKYTRSILKKPFVIIKMAMSADGKTATRTGDSKWISGKQSREAVHRMRSRFDGVMVGAGTVTADNPMLTSHGKGPDPYRIIVDAELCVPVDANVLKNKDGKTIIATSERAKKSKIEKIKRHGAMVFVCGKRDVGMHALVAGLSAMGIKKIMIEGGSELNARALEAGIVDRLYIFIAPKIIGGRDAKGVIGGKGIGRIAQALRLKKMKIRKIGKDLLLECSP